MFEGLVGRDLGEIPCDGRRRRWPPSPPRRAPWSRRTSTTPATADETFEGFFGDLHLRPGHRPLRVLRPRRARLGPGPRHRSGRDRSRLTRSSGSTSRHASCSATALRGNGVCGPAVEVAGDASDQDRLRGVPRPPALTGPRGAWTERPRGADPSRCRPNWARTRDACPVERASRLAPCPPPRYGHGHAIVSPPVGP